MTPAHEELTARPAVVGAGSVERYLPGRQRRLIGPWCFLDLFGRQRGSDTGVGPHPHIGIQTATRLFAGTSTHRDSLGSLATVAPGGLSLMTAGAGIAHAEEHSDHTTAPPVGAQLWIALPEQARDTTPAFEAFSSVTAAAAPGITLDVFAGSSTGATAPGRFYSPIVGLELHADADSEGAVPLDPEFEHGLMLLTGDLTVDGGTATEGTMAYLPPGQPSVGLWTSGGAHALVIGGAPFEEDLLMWWNFVARTEEEIRSARDDWEGGRRFGPVEGSSLERIAAPPLPAIHLHARPRLR